MIQQYAASEYAAYDHPWPTSDDEIKGVTEWFASGDHYFAVCLKETGQLVGLVALNPEEDDVHALNLGYVFDFEQLQVEKVVTGTAAENQPSCRLLERLGFEKTGESRAQHSQYLSGVDGGKQALCGSPLSSRPPFPARGERRGKTTLPQYASS
ncbi:MAG TPA: GNAT family N-acetyltransferase [Aggregatilineaceae bacterium]|nr:GNAT family N-acetyltransferase [Aggregatilineaceae bacterium]